MEEIKRTAADGYSPLTLAFIGDGVYDLLEEERELIGKLLKTVNGYIK